MGLQLPFRPHILATFMAVALVLAGLGRVAAQNGYGTAYNSEIPDSTEFYLASAQALSEKSPAQALDLFAKALESAIVHRNRNAEGRAYLSMAEIQAKLGRNGLAEENLQRCKAVFAHPALPQEDVAVTLFSNSSQAPAMNNVAPAFVHPMYLKAALLLTQVYEDNQQLPLALAESEECLLWMSGLPQKREQNTLLRTHARLLSKSGRAKEAEERFLQLLDSEQKAGDDAGECETLISFAEHWQRNANNAKAKKLLEKAIALAQAKQFPEKNLRANRLLATVFKAEGDLEGELGVRNSLVELSNQNNDYVGSSTQNIAIGNAYLQANQPAMAEKFVETAVKNITSMEPLKAALPTPSATTMKRSSEGLQQGADAYRQLAEGYLKKDELQKSIEFYKKYAVLQDSVKAVHARELAEAVELSKRLGKNEQRVELLERERAVSDNAISLLQQDQALKGSQIFTRNLIIGILGACLLLVVGGGFVLAKNTRARRRADKLLALQSMSGQMNPHFIFNALNSVNEFISQNDERAANRYLSSFSRLMRKVMDDSKHSFIPLTEEIEMLRLYLELEHARFKEQFSYQFEVDESLGQSDFQLPPMMVQPYIENAIWHGLRYRTSAGKLSIHFGRKDALLCITIADDGIGVEKSKALKTPHQKRQHSMGMKNISTRINLMNEIYASGMEVRVRELHPGMENPGTEVQILIPQHLPSTEKKTQASPTT